MIPGVGTVTNVIAVLVGSGIGAVAGHRFPERTRTVVTDGLGLITLVIAGSSAAAVVASSLTDAVGTAAPMLILLGSVIIGGIVGSSLRIEDRLEGFGGWLRARAASRLGEGEGAAERERFIQGFVVSSLIFCVGPLAILGSVTEGLGQGPQPLLLKSALDFFASIAFAAAYGWGVAASVISLVAVQGGLTALGFALGDFLPDAHVAALTATGGVLLIGVALRLLELKQVKVGDLLPALVVAPLLTQVVVLVR